jgi:hypothetical protein
MDKTVERLERVRNEQVSAICCHSFGEGQSPEKMRGHSCWRVRQARFHPEDSGFRGGMLAVLEIASGNCVVEFAPSLGVSARMVLCKHPAAYSRIEREQAAADRL